MKLSALAEVLEGVLQGNDASFQKVSIDSRQVNPGDCFFAIKGEFFDGHDFVNDVAKKNVAAIVIDHDVDLSSSTPVIRVKNTRAALVALAKHYRSRLDPLVKPEDDVRNPVILGESGESDPLVTPPDGAARVILRESRESSDSVPVIGITGSCGKTTTRALLQNILSQSGKVLASQKSFNNDIGLPLTLLQLQPDHQYVVLELGTNHPGEIAALTAIAQPTISVVTMIAPVHVEGFEANPENGSPHSAIAKEKGEIYAGLPQEGIAIINNDDVFADYFKKVAGSRRIVTFGIHQQSDVMAKEIKIHEEGFSIFSLQLNKVISVSLPLLGEHNILNALAAAAIAFALEVPIEKIKLGLETVQPEYGRMNIKKAFNGATIIDDSYNANPASVEAAIKLLARRSKKSILVLGDMKELGSVSEESHRRVGECAVKCGIAQLFCYGKETALTATTFGKKARFFEDQQALIQALRPVLTPDTTVLIKGSNSMKMVNIVKALEQA